MTTTAPAAAGFNTASFLETLTVDAPFESGVGVEFTPAWAPPELAAIENGDAVIAMGERHYRPGDRLSAVSVIDSKGRISLQRVLKAMDWAADVELVTEVTGRNVVVRPRADDDETRVADAAVDTTGRLVLTSPVRGWLHVAHGDRVQAVANPTTKSIHLFAEKFVLAALLADGFPPSTPTPTPECETKAPTRTSKVRKARYNR